MTDILGEDPAEFSLRLSVDLGIPPLSEYGITPAHVPALCRKAMEASSMKANPIRLTQEELEAILTAALGQGRQPA